jgi:hypothetical protein
MAQAETHSDIPKDGFESQFSSKAEIWGNLTVLEKLEEINKGNSYFLKIVSDDATFFLMPDQNSESCIISDERAKFLANLAQAILLANFCLMGSAVSMEAEEIYEVKRILENIINYISDTNERIANMITKSTSALLSEIYVSKDIISTIDDLHLEKSQKKHAKTNKNQTWSRLNDSYANLWKATVIEIEKIAKTRKVSAINWLSSLAPLQNFIFQHPASVSSSMQGSEVLEIQASKQSKPQRSSVASIEDTPSGPKTQQNSSQPWESLSSTKPISLYRPKSASSPSNPIVSQNQIAVGSLNLAQRIASSSQNSGQVTSLAETDFQPASSTTAHPSLPPLPLKKNKSKKSRTFSGVEILE